MRLSLLNVVADVNLRTPCAATRLESPFCVERLGTGPEGGRAERGECERQKGHCSHEGQDSHESHESQESHEDSKRQEIHALQCGGAGANALG